MLLASLRDVHVGWAWVVVIGNGVAGTWALIAHVRPQLRGRPLWWFTAAAELAVFVQVGFGVALGSSRGSDPRRFHELYGYLGIISVGILYSYRHQLRDRLHLLYGLGGLFIMGLGIRAMLLGV